MRLNSVFCKRSSTGGRLQDHFSSPPRSIPRTGKISPESAYWGTPPYSGSPPQVAIASFAKQKSLLEVQKQMYQMIANGGDSQDPDNEIW